MTKLLHPTLATLIAVMSNAITGIAGVSPALSEAKTAAHYLTT